MSRQSEGGRSALAGYLYQILGAATVAVWAHFPEISTGLQEWVGYLRRRGDTRVFHERYGDAAIEAPDSQECTLIEFKYSLRGRLDTIGPVDLKEIANALHRERDRAEADGLEVVGYELVTNRRIGREGKKLLQRVKAGSDEPESPLPNPLKKGWQWCILHKLEVHEQIPESEWYNELRAFARAYGLFDPEIEEGIERLIAAIIKGTRDVGGKEITREGLIEKIVGYPNARQLTPESVAPTSQATIRDFLDRPDGGLATQEAFLLIRERILEQIGQAVSERRALVVLCGDGGCGKTVALQQWAEDLVVSRGEGTGAFTILEAACGVPSHWWVAETVSDWRSLPVYDKERRCESVDLALGRVRTANEGLAPLIVHLGLDGVDEDLGLPERERWVREIVNWFWERDRADRRGLRDEEPQAVLVVTCRELENFEYQWLDGDREGWGIGSEQTKEVRTDVFEPEELQKAAEMACDADIVDRIEEALRRRSSAELGIVEGRTWPAQRVGVPTWHAAELEVVEALLHPVMWGAFLRMGDRDVQVALLEGDQEAKRKLAETFLRRFVRRAKKRLAHRLEWREVRKLLCTVACTCRGTAQHQHTRQDWKEAACGTRLVDDNAAERWYGEARSGGLIARGNARGSWIWRHRIVWEYLAQQTEARYDE